MSRTPSAILASALRDPGGRPSGLDDVNGRELVDEACRHRVLLLVGWTLRHAGTLARWPQEFRSAFERAERDAVAVDCVRQVELGRVLGEVARADVRAILIKGAALAHTHYPAPHLRVRTDTDLVVAASDVPALERVLVRLGYTRPAEASGALVSYQSHYYRTDVHGVEHAVDVHWKISNLQALADSVTLEELWQDRVAVPALGPAAYTTSDVHALLLSLVHRAGHHPGSHNLLWIYDLHLLVSRLGSAELEQFERLAEARGLGQIAADGLALARDRFGAAERGRAPMALRRRGAVPTDVPLIQGPWTQARVLRMDLAALPDWRTRGRLIREHLLPPPSYMRARYGVRSSLLLPALYLWRALAGAPKWLRIHHAEE